MHVFLVCWDAIIRGVGDHHWLTIVTAIGAVATAAGVATGGWLAARYGRRASASISAQVYATPQGVVMATRPSVKAVGIFRVKFHVTKGVKVHVQEVFISDDGELASARYWENGTNWGQQYVDAGEELTTTVLFRLLDPPVRVIGWQVYLSVSAPTRLVAPNASASWVDQIFVALPDREDG